jgi:uncharacterized protein (DUF2342 family)
MPIEHGKGGTTLTGDSIEFYRIAAMRSAVGLECQGIKLHRGPVLWKRVAKEFGIKGNKFAVYRWLCAKVELLAPQQMHIEDGKATVDGMPVQ